MSLPADPAALAHGVIAVGFAGTTPADAPLDALRAFEPGGVILFARNVGTADELRALVTALRAVGTPAPLVTIDQEGGRVARISGEAVAALPSAMAVGATGDAELAGRLGTLLGRDLARLGFSADFAPVADLSLQPGSTVVGTRSYGDDPERVAAFVTAFAHGLERGGVAAALKHFPGHGSTAADSHVALPRVDATAATLRARDLVPFARAIAARAASIVMTAHVVTPFDPLRPATLSPAVLAGLLRDELGFDGVIATDCLEMDAIARGVGTVNGAVAALAAGADLLTISHRIDVAHEAADAIAAAVRDGRLSLVRLQDAFARVRALRERLAVPAPYAQALDDGSPLDAARRAVTAVRGDVRLRENKPVTVISFEGAAVDNAGASGGARAAESPSLSSALRRRRWKSEVMRVPLEPDAEDLALLLEHVPRLGDREFVVVTRDAHRYPAQRDAVARLLLAAPDALVVSAQTPYDALLWPAARRVACIYGDRPLSFEACADVLSGRVAASGSLPVRLRENVSVR